jgi:hypothetical protein
VLLSHQLNYDSGILLLQERSSDRRPIRTDNGGLEGRHADFPILTNFRITGPLLNTHPFTREVNRFASS